MPQSGPGDGSPKVARPPWLTKEGFCYVCKGRRFWLSVHGVLVCARCHPPASPKLVARWIGSDTGGDGR